MSNQGPVRIERARSTEDIESVAFLFAEYAKSLGFDLTFQDFDTELRSLPGKYAPPGGEILLARNVDGIVVGCVAVRPLDLPSCCEMKRLYILPAGRGLGIGRKLVSMILEIAGSLGYEQIKLDTLSSMAEAIGLYTKAGFVSTTPYYETPLDGTLFMVRRLQST